MMMMCVICILFKINFIFSGLLSMTENVFIASVCNSILPYNDY